MIKKQAILLIAIYITTLTSCIAQNNKENSKLKISVGKNIIVGTASDQQYIEPWVDAHPTNPNHLIAVAAAASAVNKKDLDIENCAIFVSKDGGKSWKKHDIPGKGGIDSWVSYSDNRAVVTTLGESPVYEEYKFNSYHQLLVHTSEDGGDTWTKTPQSLGRGHDSPRSVSDRDGRTYIITGKGYLDGTTPRIGIYVASVHPKTGYAEKLTLIGPSNLNQVNDGLTTLSDGTLVITYHDFQKPADYEKYGKFAGRLKTRRVWAMTSKDKGKTFSVPKLITEASYGRPTDLVADTSNVYRDRLYNVSIGDKFKSIIVTHSADGGEQWSDPILVEPLAPSNQERLIPQIAVNKDGIVAVAWMDNRDNPTGKCYAPYIIFSTDGGNTFSNLTKVGSELSCPTPSQAGEYISERRRWLAGGDYFGLTTTADGKFHVVWPDARSGKFDLMTSAITVKKQ